MTGCPGAPPPHRLAGPALRRPVAGGGAGGGGAKRLGVRRSRRVGGGGGGGARSRSLIAGSGGRAGVLPHGSLEGVGGLKTNEAYRSKTDVLLIPEMYFFFENLPTPFFGNVCFIKLGLFSALPALPVMIRANGTSNAS